MGARRGILDGGIMRVAIGKQQQMPARCLAGAADVQQFQCINV